MLWQGLGEGKEGGKGKERAERERKSDREGEKRGNWAILSK